MTDAQPPVPSQLSSSTTHVVYAALRFLRVVRHRRTIVFTTLVVAGLLGSIYYATAKRLYQAKSSLLVFNNQPEPWKESITQDGHRQGMLPTYEELFYSTKVLNGAIALLSELPPAARIDLTPFPRNKWLDEIRDRLQANTIRATNIIEVSYVSGNPRTAEATVNAIVQSYSDYIEESHRSVVGEIATLLKVDLAKIDKRLKEKTEQLARAKLQAKDLGISNSDVVHPVVQKVDKTHADLVEVQQKRIQLQSSLYALQNAIQSGGNLQQHLLTLEPTVGREVILGALGLSTKDSEVVTHLERMLFDERAELERLTAFYLENHRDIQYLSSRVNRLRQEIANYSARRSPIAATDHGQQLGNLLLSLVTEDLQRTWAHEQALRLEFQRAESDALQLANQRYAIEILEKEEQRLRRLDESLQTQLDNIDIKTNQSDVRVAIVSEALADNLPVSPRLLWVVFICVVVGTGAGTGIIYVLDILDDRFRSPEELRDQLGAPVLAMIRQLPDTDHRGADALQVFTAPDSIESEAFRTLRTTVAFAGGETDCLAISSSEPGDGKTTVLANFGVACAQSARRTLLIDADMRRPGLSKLFEVRGHKGLGDLLRAEREVDVMAAELVAKTGVPEMDMIPAGTRPSDPTGLLSGSRFAELVAWAQANYSQVLIDTPPILAASDATVIGRVVDGLVLVVQPEKNHRRLVHRAAEEIHSADLSFVGVVANRVGEDSGGDYYGGGYGYGYGYGYGSGYGTEEHTVTAHDAAANEDAVGGRAPASDDETVPLRIRPRRAA